MAGATRRAARIVAIDRSGRVLLLQHAGAVGRPFWATPGGGLEPGETFEDAARRECGEELGVHVEREQLELGWTGTARFNFGGKSVEQEEHFFVLRVDGFELRAECEETHRREGILHSQWWAVSELAATREVVFPEDLAERVACLTVGRAADDVASKPSRTP